MTSDSWYAQFLADYATFQATPLYLDMCACTEASSHHREQSVASHTDAALTHYMLNPPSDPNQAYWGALACLFHDVGNPPTHRFNQTIGRRGFAGHEQASARMFVDYALMYLPNLSNFEVYVIEWLILHHLPWGTKNERKLSNLIATALAIGSDAWTAVLLVDQLGRLSDTLPGERLSRAVSWINACIPTASAHDHSRFSLPSGRVAVMLIGLPGAGKSTITQSLIQHYDGHRIVECDAIRERMFPCADNTLSRKQQYARSFNESTANAPSFDRAVRDAVVDACNSDESAVIIDEVHLSRKDRAKTIAVLRASKRTVVGVYVMCDSKTACERQQTRVERDVPVTEIIRMHRRLQAPSLGEFDYVVVS